MPNTLPYVKSVNVGRPQTVHAGSLEVTSAIWKYPVAERLALTSLNLAGDEQADLEVHGGPDKAVYAYASEDLAWWAHELDQPVDAGAVGENLTTSGIDLNEARIGDRWAVGSAVLEVSQPRIPCYKLGIRFDDQAMPKRFAVALRPGAYLRVISTGDIGTGDTIEVVSRPAHETTIGLVATAYHRDHRLAARFADTPELPESWRRWASQFTGDAPR